MHGSYRGIIFAIVGWLALIGASQPQQENKRGNPRQDVERAAAPTSDYAAYADMNATECYQADNHDAADLCAQWRAALAAEKAAEAARLGNYIGAVAALLSLGSIALVVMALKQTEKSLRLAHRDRATATRRAVAAAGEAAAALAIAREQVAISDDTAKRQLRAYITVEPCGINQAEKGLHRVPLLLENQGATPAKNVMVFGYFAIVGNFHPREFNPSDLNVTLTATPSDGVIGPKAPRYVYAFMPSEIAKPYLLEIDAEQVAIVHFGFVSYDDDFGQPRETHFAFYHWGEELSDVASKRCAMGNYST